MEYQSKRHEEYVRSMEEDNTIVQCILDGARCCNPRCGDFYDCWVKEKDNERIKE